MSLGTVPQALSPLQMEVGKEKTGPDWDPWATCENRLGGARVDVGGQGRGSVALKCCAAPYPEVGQRTGGRTTRSTDPEHTSDCSRRVWARLQVHAFVQNWTTPHPGISFTSRATFIVTYLGSFHPPLKTSSSWSIFT